MKAFKKVLFVFLATAFVQNAQADDLITVPGVPSAPATEACVPKSEMQAIAKNFSQFKQYANADYCYDGSQISNLISSIMFMRKTAFEPMSNSKDEFFTGRFSSSWYDYFVGRIDELEIVASCQKGVVAYVYAFGGKTMYACPMALTDQFSSLDRASVFMHEARHIDGFPHMTCSKGARQGLQGACDRNISDGGSYAVTVETYAQLAKYAIGVHPALKAYSRASAAVYADEAFENPVRINRTENLLMLTSALEFHSMNLQTSQVTKLGHVAAAGHIIRRGQHMIMIPDDKNLKAQYVFARDEGEIAQSPSDLLTEYNAQTPVEKANLIDLHIAAQWTARVYKNMVRFACDPTAATLTDIQIPAGMAPANLLYINGYDRAAYTTQLAMQNGDIYDIGCVNRRASLTPSMIKLDQKFKRIYKVAGQTFGLAESKLFKIENSKSVPFASVLNGSIIEIMPQQTFEFFETAN